jgi:uncharacterized protein
METVLAAGKPFDYHRLGTMSGVIIALFWPFLFIHASHDLTGTRVIVRSISAEWGVALLLALIAFRTLRRRPSWFGIGMFGWRDVLAMVAALAGLFLLAGALRWYFSIPSSREYLRKLGAIPLSLRALLVLTAGITEEFMYRGFALEELAALIGKRRLAALVSMVCFTAAHSVRVGLSPALLLVGCAGAVLTILYLWRRNLPVCMLMHVIVDGIGIIVVPAVYRAHGG